MRCLGRHLSFLTLVFLVPALHVGDAEVTPGDGYLVRLTSEGGKIDNPALGFRADFDAERLRVVPAGADPGWTVGLRVVAYGSRGRATPVVPGPLHVRNNRWKIERGRLTEWYVNDARGLKQGFTLWEPPETHGPDGEQTLFVDVEIASDLVRSLSPDDRSVEFRRPGDRFAALCYTGLVVTDAGDRELPARLELLSRSDGFEGGVRIVVETAGARFPVTIDPLVTTASWSSAETDNSTDAAWGDWDGDGDLDLAIGNTSAQVNRVYENDGGVLMLNPGGGLGWNSTETDDTDAVAWGDWDNDGDLDLAVGNSNQVNRIYENDGLGLSTSLTLVWSSTETDNTTSVAWGDWDGDGDLDLAVANLDQVNRVYTNDGLGTSTSLTLTWSSTETETTSSVAWGDIDGDGDLDLAVGNNINTQPNRVYQNDGLGTATSLTPYWASTDLGQSARGIAWGDFDEDGDLDLAAGNSVRNTLYENTGTTLNPAPIWITVEIGISSNGVAWGDWDGDGDIDLLAAGSAGPPSRNRVWINLDGALSVGSSWEALEFDTSRAAVWGDIDGDGDLDVATANDGQPNRVYLNDGGPLSTIAAWSTAEAISTKSMAWGDWDGDGDLDLAVGNRFTEPNHVFENDGLGQLSLVWTSSEAEDTHRVAWGDWDGDGDLDLAVGNAGYNRVYENDGLGLSDSLTLTWSSPEAESTFGLAWGDWDGDGDLDLAAGNYLQANRVYENDGLGLPGSLVSVWSVPQSDGTIGVAWGDWDGDGDLDLAIASHTGGLSTVWENDGLGQPDSLVPVWNPPGGGDVRDLAWGDWDGDGDLDLAFGSDTDQPIRVYENDGLGLSTSLTEVWTSTETDNTGGVAWGDWDGDGDLDLAAANNGTANRVYENDGESLSSTAVWSSVEQDATFAAAWGDWDGDGDLDLAVANLIDQENRIYENGLMDRPGDLPETPTHPAVPEPPGTTPSAYFFSTPQLLTAPIVIGYVLFDGQTDHAWQIVPEYSLNGGGQWLPATEGLGGGGTTNLAASPGGTPHDFFWDAAADAAYSDNVVFRITVTRQVPDHVSYPVQRGTLSTVTPPFRVAVDTDGDRVADVVDNCPSVPNPTQLLSTIGDHAWIDTDGDGIQDGGEAGFASLPVVLYDDSFNLLQARATDVAGDYQFLDLCPGNYVVGFFLPAGYSFSPPGQGGESGLDSDADPVTGLTGVITLTQDSDRIEFDAGLVPGCDGPDEPVYISHMELTDDGNNYPILTFLDPNQPSDVTGYNVYRSDNASLPVELWPMIASNVVDMDAERPNHQWIDTSGDEPVAGPAWFYHVTAYSSVCDAEGPF